MVCKMSSRTFYAGLGLGEILHSDTRYWLNLPAVTNLQNQQHEHNCMTEQKHVEMTSCARNWHNLHRGYLGGRCKTNFVTQSHSIDAELFL